MQARIEEQISSVTGDDTATLSEQIFVEPRRAGEEPRKSMPARWRAPRRRARSRGS
jgi:hypothetical protein